MSTMPYSGKYTEGGRSNRPRTFQVDQRLVQIAKKVSRDKEWPTRIRDPEGGSLPPPEAYPMDSPPIGLVAPVASLEAVLADPESELAELISEGYDDACVVEMEGYGAVYAASQERVPSILVRGVSDITRDKSPETDAERQPVAACHAAAFAFEMLSHWAQAFPSVDPYAPRAIPESMAAEPLQGANLTACVGRDFAGGVEMSAQSPVANATSTVRDALVAPDLLPDFVLHFDEAFPSELEARLSTIETLLREILKSDSLKVTGADTGSLHVFVADPLGVLRNFGVAGLRDALVERNEAGFLGMVDMKQYESLETLREQLTRASMELMVWPISLPDGEEIVRPESAQLLERLEDSITSTTAVLGTPGAGKSALLAALAHRVHQLGWPVLAIKGDLLYPDISGEDDLQRHLGLDALPSTQLQRLAKFQPVLLILDQLDALAGYLDLRTARLSTLLNLVRKLGGTDNVHIVLSSRIFEFEHDVRLNAVSAESLTLQLPPWSDILALLEARGVRAAGWPEDAQEVMRTPQALSTYLRLVEPRPVEPFTSYQAMLDHLWNERVLVGDGGAHRGLLATEVAESMADEESLSLASARFDGRVNDIAALEAVGMLTRTDGSISFAHQTLFEYALARSFSRQKGRLSAYVLERQTSLFLRPKLWAGLTYLRAVESNTYHFELESIWTASDLRPHLRRLLIDFLGQQTYPTDRETLLMECALDLPDQRWPAFRALSGSPGWFERFGPTFIADCMSENDETSDQMTQVLSRAWSFAEDAVTQLLLDRWAPHTHHDLRCWMVLEEAPRWTDGALDLARTIIRRTEVAPFSIDRTVASIGVEQPETALHLVRARLDHQLARAQAEADNLTDRAVPEFEGPIEQQAYYLNHSPQDILRKVIESEGDWETLPTLAEQSPLGFLDILWPWFEKYFEALKAVTPERQGQIDYALSLDADFRFEQEPGMDLPTYPLLLSLQTAAESLVRTDPEAWLIWVERLGGLDIAPAQRLIAHTFAVSPGRFSDKALSFLLEDPRRYMLGSIHDLVGTSTRLVKAASEYWSEKEIAQFETTVNNFQPAVPPDLTDPAKRLDWNKYVREIKLALNRSLPKNRLTGEALRHVEEEERALPDRRLGVRSTGVQVVRAIMNAGQMARASDEDVVNAFRSVPDASGWDHPRHFMMDGNVQLSREFSTFAKKNPDRAIRLLKSFEPEYGTRAAGYALEAMSEETEPDQILQLLLDVAGRGFDGEEFRSSACRAVTKLVGHGVTIGEDIIDLLDRWLATPTLEEKETEDSDSNVGLVSGMGTVEVPETEGAVWDEIEREEAKKIGPDGPRPGEEDDGSLESLLWGMGAFSIVPGGDYPVVETLTRIRILREDFDQLYRMLLNFLERNKDPRVWDHLLRFLPGLYPTDPIRKAEILERIFSEVPELVESKAAVYLLANAYWWDADFAHAQLDRWRDAGKRNARQAYGEIVAVASLIRPDIVWAQARLQALIEDHTLVDARAGAALTAANLWVDAQRRSSANNLLIRLIHGGGAGVWEATFEVFRLTDELRPDTDTVALLTIIAERLADAPRLDATFVVERLATLLPHHALLVGHVAEGLIAAWRSELGDIRTRTAIAAPQLVDLAVTLHRLGPETRDIGTRLFEQLIEVNAWEARRTLDQIDNRFLEQAPRRPRLARRNRARHRTRRRDLN